MFGYAASEVVGRPITLIIPPDRLSEEAMVLARVRVGEQIEMETVRQRKDGTLVPISLMVSPITDAGGRVIAASKIARDITDRTRFEQERAEVHRRLATLVEASASLLHSTDTASVVTTVMRVAQEVLVADGYAIWTSSWRRCPTSCARP